MVPILIRAADHLRSQSSILETDPGAKEKIDIRKLEYEDRRAARAERR
jgi:hypothetical protein